MSKKVLTVYLSQTNCIYENLAIEECIFRNHNLSKNGNALLLWRFFIYIYFFYYFKYFIKIFL